MHPVAVFALEEAACLAVSVLILARLQHLLRRLGTQCEKGGASTEFWVAYTQLMMIVAPMLLVAWWSHAGWNSSEVEQLKSSLSVVLAGQFLGLALVGRAVWKVIASPAREDKPAVAAPGSTVAAEAA